MVRKAIQITQWRDDKLAWIDNESTGETETECVSTEEIERATRGEAERTTKQEVESIAIEETERNTEAKATLTGGKSSETRG